MDKRKQAIKEFEDMKDKALIKVLSKKSLKEPLSESEFNQYQDAFHRYYGVPNIIKQSFKQMKGGKEKNEER